MKQSSDTSANFPSFIDKQPLIAYNHNITTPKLMKDYTA
jgi:hypothetical protein